MGGGKNTVAPKRASTLAREAYFLEFARALRRKLTMPIMLTGGLRSRSGMQEALDEGVDLLGVARPACVDPVNIARFLIGEIDTLPSWEENLRVEKGLLSNNSPLSMVRTVASFAGIYWFYEQVYRLGRGAVADLKAVPLMSMARVMLTERGIEAQRKKLKRMETKADTVVVARSATSGAAAAPATTRRAALPQTGNVTPQQILAARQLNRRETAGA
jgi:hypothetical protein